MPMFVGPWLPGSFTKNFSWGKGQGLLQLYDNINLGFNGEMKPVLRSEYRSRTDKLNRSSFVPLNFFLLNEIKDGRSYIAVDELVFQALSAPHSERFDKLALFAFNLSIAGQWKGARPGQRYPALWAREYIIERVAKVFKWDTSKITASDIERFLISSEKFEAETTRKVATNLNFLYREGGLNSFAEPRIERWWVDALFLAIDRLTSDQGGLAGELPPKEQPSLLLRSRFAELTGPTTTEKSFAMAHLLSLYNICGAKRRFDIDSIKDRISVIIPEYVSAPPNDARPQGALHPTNPRIVKTIPRDCAPLAEAVGFQIIWADDLDAFDPDEFIKTRAKQASINLTQSKIASHMTADELHKLTRGE